MKKKFGQFYIISPIIYAFVICLFLVFHFTAKDSFKTGEIGYFTISGKKAKSKFLNENDILELQADFGPFKFFFSDSNPVVLEPDNGQKIRCRVESFLSFENTAEIHFDKGINLAFIVSGDSGSSLIVKPEIVDKKLTAKIKNIKIPIKITGIDTEYTNSLPVISSKNNYGFFFLSLSHGCKIDSKNRQLILKVLQNDAVSNIDIEKINKNNMDPYLYWYKKNTPPHNTQEYQEATRNFLDLAYEGWTNTRYLDDENLWTTKTEKAIYNEELVLASLSEALKRNEYRKVLALVQSAWNRKTRIDNDEDFPFKTSLYLGNIQKAVDIFNKRDIKEIKRFQELLLAEDLSVFNIPNLILLLLDRGNISQIDELANLILQNTRYKDIDIPTCLGMIESYYNIKLWIKTKIDYFERLGDLIYDKILPHLIITEKGLFLLDDLSNTEKLVNIRQSVRAGNILILFGMQTNNEDLSYVGQKLVLSSISLSDNEAFLPKEIVIQSFEKQEEHGYLEPESIYEYIAEDRYTPKEIPLDPEIKPGNWMWTVSQIKSYNIDEYESNFLLSFPSGATHYLFIQGMPSVTSLYLYGYKIDANPEYYYYPYGWFYDENVNTLYIKILHRSDNEQVIIKY